MESKYVYMKQYKYHYNNEFPIELFIKNKKRKNKKNLLCNNPNTKSLQIYKKTRKIDKIINTYYKNYKYMHNSEEYRNNRIINKLNEYTNNINLYNANELYYQYKLIYDFMEIYKINIYNEYIYNTFKEYVRKNNEIKKYIIYKGTVLNFFKNSKSCYMFLKDIINYSENKIIKLLSIMELSVDKIKKTKS